MRGEGSEEPMTKDPQSFDTSPGTNREQIVKLEEKSEDSWQGSAALPGIPSNKRHWTFAWVVG